MTLDLSQVANGQTLGIFLSQVDDSYAIGDVFLPLRVLAGDSDGNGSVSAADVAQTKARANQGIWSNTFRSDFNHSGGTINAADISFAKASVGTALP